MMNEFIWIKVSFHKEINLFAIQNGIKSVDICLKIRYIRKTAINWKIYEISYGNFVWFAFRIIRDLWMIIERFVLHSCWNCTNLKWSMSSKCNASKSSIAYFTHMTNIIVQKRVPNSRNYEIWNILLEFLRNKTEP